MKASEIIFIEEYKAFDKMFVPYL